MTKIQDGTVALILYFGLLVFALSMPIWTPNDDAVWHHIFWVDIGLSYLWLTIGIIQLIKGTS